ncbi:MAG: ATP-binding protein [Candidatus Aenigmarchaeota archaeon]|nr:ATP-binding protein [Candidatus Aenigmarchaeota archaeon]
MEAFFDEWNAYATKKALKSRDIALDRMESDAGLKIVGLTGIRRSGKSSLLMLLLQKLIHESKKAAYVNLEDSRIKDSKTILDDIIKWFGDDGYLLLDEITGAHDWEGWLARNHELLKDRLKLIVSSSLKKLAVPVKPLRGRMLIQELYPLSFREFLQFRRIKLERTTAGIGRIERALDEYLVYGGFPEVVLANDKTDKIRLLGSYFNDIIALDVSELSGEDTTTVSTFGKYIIEATYFSASKCLNFFKALGHKIGKQTILNLEKYSEDGYLFFFVPIFSYTAKDKLQYPRKAYLGDTGFLHAISGRKDKGRVFENAVFLEMKRRLQPQQEINYWKNKEGAEVDFIVREGLRTTEIINVVYDLSDEKTKRREIKGLVACAKECNLKDSLLITRNIEGTEVIDGVKISYIPLWRWLLNAH